MSPITTAARRIARAHNYARQNFLLYPFVLSFTLDGRGIIRGEEHALPRSAYILVHVMDRPMTQAEAQDIIDAHAELYGRLYG